MYEEQMISRERLTDEQLYKIFPFAERKLNALYEVEYVRELSIQDHIKEVGILYDELKRKKNTGADCTELQEAIDKESVDLMLILERHYRDNVSLLRKRRGKFKEYGKLDEEELKRALDL